MEERIINYEREKDVLGLILEHRKKDFILVQHSTRKKELHFKKFPTDPETIIIGER